MVFRQVGEHFISGFINNRLKTAWNKRGVDVVGKTVDEIDSEGFTVEQVPENGGPVPMPRKPQCVREDPGNWQAQSRVEILDKHPPASIAKMIVRRSGRPPIAHFIMAVMGVEVDDQMVRETADIQHLLDRVIVLIDRQILLVDEIHQGVNHRLIAMAAMDDDVIRIQVVVICKVELVVPVANAQQPPVFSIDVMATSSCPCLAREH